MNSRPTLADLLEMGLTPRAQLVYLYLHRLRRLDRLPPRPPLARRFSCSVSSLQRAVRELREHGLLGPGQ